MYTETFFDKIERYLFSTLYTMAIILTALGIFQDNYAVIQAIEEMELSKNKREIEIADDYQLNVESNVIAK